jgi:hypothetical protein
MLTKLVKGLKRVNQKIMNSDDFITVSRAREVMGSDADNMSDEEVQDIIDKLSALALAFVGTVLKYD